MTTYTITKMDIAKELLRKLQDHNYSHTKDLKKLTAHVDALLDEIEYQLDKGNRVSLLRVGTLRPLSKSGRPGRIPKLNQPHWIPPRRTVTFYGADLTSGSRGTEPKITTSELREIMAGEMGNKRKGALLVNTFIEQLRRVEQENCRVELRNFGVFTLREVKPRLARNPATGDKLISQRKMRINYRVSPAMVQRITDSYIERHGEIVTTKRRAK